MPKAAPLDPPLIICPFVVAIDSREQAPYRFTGIDETVIQTTTQTLTTGDYSIVGFESRIAVERKSLPDYLGSIGAGRERFEREMQRLAAMEYAAVVIESEWSEIFNEPSSSRVTPKMAARTAISWSIRYGVHFWAMPGRRAAEVWTFRLLEMFWRQEQRRLKELEKALAAV